MPLDSNNARPDIYCPRGVVYMYTTVEQMMALGKNAWILFSETAIQYDQVSEDNENTPDKSGPNRNLTYDYRAFVSGCRFFNKTTDTWDTQGVEVKDDFLYLLTDSSIKYFLDFCVDCFSKLAPCQNRPKMIINIYIFHVA